MSIFYLKKSVIAIEIFLRVVFCSKNLQNTAKELRF